MVLHKVEFIMYGWKSELSNNFQENLTYQNKGTSPKA